MSYDVSSELMSEKLGKNEIMLSAGSYNAGNQPEYGNDWEYYDVEHIVWSSGGDGETVKRKSFDTKAQAITYYDSMVKSVLKIHKSSEIVTEKEIQKAYNLGKKAYKENKNAPSEDSKITKMIDSKTSISAVNKVANSWWDGYKYAELYKDPLIASIKSTISKPSSKQKEKEYIIYSGIKKFGKIKAFTLSDAKARVKSTFGTGFTVKEKPSDRKDKLDKIYKHLTRTMEVYPGINKSELKKISGESRYYVDKFWREYRK